MEIENQSFNQLYKNTKFLDKQTAFFRSQSITGLPNYKVHFTFEKETNSFNTYEEVEFNLTSEPFKKENENKHFFIDYDSKIQPQYVKVNETVLTAEQIQVNWSGIFLNLPKEYLLEGKLNKVVMEYENNFVTDGNGLYNFIDVDGKQYIYSHLEPNFCNKIFATFDQPDLKAQYEISVVSPKEWVNIANGKQDKQVEATLENLNNYIAPINQVTSASLIAKNIEGKNFTIFEKTVSFSTYIFFIGTGDFDFVELPEEKCYKKIPQRIYVRESLKKHCLKISDQIFELMNKLIPFYEQFFHFDFPWSKYDHIFCPDFNIGAMENVGAVTFNDNRIPRGPQTTQTLSNIYNVMAHELVHTWFGDLITMFWWDDLWLKESFADFLSYYAISQLDLSFPVTEQSIMFNTRKSWGIQADSKNSTHNIAGVVDNTEQAKSIFDGITYAKGAATLKQLMFLVGAENFSKAMGSYCQKYNFKTATLDNLIECLSEQFSNPKFTLKEWQSQWLQTPGLNIIEPLFELNSPKNQLTIKQSALLSDFPTLRFHKIKVGFYKQDGSVDVKEVILNNSEETVLEYDASQDYKAVLLNYEDLDFVKVIIDDNSFQFFESNFGLVKNALDQILIIRGIYELVHDGVIKAEQYIQFLANNLHNAASDEVFENLFATAQSIVADFTPSSIVGAFGSKIVQSLISYLRFTKDLSDSRIVVARSNILHFASSVKDPETFEYLLKWYNNQNEELKDYQLTVDNQWEFVVLAHKQPESSFTLAQKKALFEQQKGIDNSDTVMYKQRTCEALLEIQGQDQEAQDKRWNIFITCAETRYQILAGLQGFNQPRYKENIQRFYEKFLDTDLLTTFENNTVTNSLQFANFMFPKTQEFEWLYNKIEDLIPRVPKQHHTLLRFLSDQKDILAVKMNVFKRQYSLH